jgi:ATP-dependent Lon protease
MLETDIRIPDCVPVMTMRETVFFPHTIMPLYIFEQRYRRMLRDVLRGNRLFAVAKEDVARAEQTGVYEPLHHWATVGIVRAAHKNRDGTTNLVMQGIARVEVLQIVREEPYRTIQVRPVCSVPGGSANCLREAQAHISSLLQVENCLREDLPDEFVQFLGAIEDPETYLDLTIHSLCQVPDVRQQLLETINTLERFQRFASYLEGKVQRCRLFQQLQGPTRDEEIGLN